VAKTFTSGKVMGVIRSMHEYHVSPL
jgi:hypothetical protein